MSAGCIACSLRGPRLVRWLSILLALKRSMLGFADTDPKMLIPLAEKLMKLNVRLESGGLNGPSDR
jgi:hypothetical protein